METNIVPLAGYKKQKVNQTLGAPLVVKSMGPIELKLQGVLGKLENSKFESKFDWGTYDRIGERYGENQPRGGVMYNQGLKLVNHHSSCSKCHYSLELDTYGRGCIHDCIYCYARETLTRHGYWNKPMPFPVNLAEIWKTFYTVFETDKDSKWRSILEKRVPIRIGSMSDSFMFMDKKYGVTLELLRMLKHYEYPYVIFTRSDLVAEQQYLNVMDPKLASIQLSVSGGNEELTRKLEPGAPSVARRLKALKNLVDAGFWTAARINPLFPTFPDGYYTDRTSIIKRFGSLDNVPKFDLFEPSFINQLAETGVQTLLAGFVRLHTFALRNMKKELGLDLFPFFKPELSQNYGDNRYSDSEIAFYYKLLQIECAKVGIRFTTCYIGNGLKDYYKYQDLWSNKSDCCDIRGNVAGFKTTAQDIPWSDRLVHAPAKEEAMKSMKAEVEWKEEPEATPSAFSPSPGA